MGSYNGESSGDESESESVQGSRRDDTHQEGTPKPQPASTKGGPAEPNEDKMLSDEDPATLPPAKELLRVGKLVRARDSTLGAALLSGSLTYDELDATERSQLAQQYARACQLEADASEVPALPMLRAHHPVGHGLPQRQRAASSHAPRPPTADERPAHRAVSFGATPAAITVAPPSGMRAASQEQPSVPSASKVPQPSRSAPTTARPSAPATARPAAPATARPSAPAATATKAGGQALHLKAAALALRIDGGPATAPTTAQKPRAAGGAPSALAANKGPSAKSVHVPSAPAAHRAPVAAVNPAPKRAVASGAGAAKGPAVPSTQKGTAPSAAASQPATRVPPGSQKDAAGPSVRPAQPGVVVLFDINATEGHTAPYPHVVAASTRALNQGGAAQSARAPNQGVAVQSAPAAKIPPAQPQGASLPILPDTQAPPTFAELNNDADVGLDLSTTGSDLGDAVPEVAADSAPAPTSVHAPVPAPPVGESSPRKASAVGFQRMLEPLDLPDDMPDLAPVPDSDDEDSDGEDEEDRPQKFGHKVNGGKTKLDAASTAGADAAMISAQEVYATFRTTIDTLQQEGTARAAAFESGTRGPGRPTSGQARAMTLLATLFLQLILFAAGTLGIGAERIRALLGEMRKPRHISRFLLFKSFLRNTHSYWEERRKLDDMFGCKGTKYTSAEMQEHFKTFCDKFSEEEQDTLLLRHELEFPYGPEKGTSADRYNMFQSQVEKVAQLLDYLSAYLQIESTLFIAGSRVDFDRDPQMSRVYSTYHARDFVPHKFCVTNDMASLKFGAHVQNNLCNTHSDLTATEAGLPPAGRRVSMLDTVPPPAPSSHFIRPRHGSRALSQQPVASGSDLAHDSQDVSMADSMPPPPVTKPSRAKKAGELSLAVLEQHTGDLARPDLVDGTILCYTLERTTRKMHAIFLDISPLSAPHLSYQLRYTAEEKALAVQKLIDLVPFAKIRPLANGGVPLNSFFKVLRLNSKMVIGWPFLVYLYGESANRMTFDAFGEQMGRMIIMALLCELMYVTDAYVLTPAQIEQIVKLVGIPPNKEKPARVLCITEAAPPGVGSVNWAGTRRVLLDNHSVIGVPSLTFSSLLPSPIDIPPENHPFKGPDIPVPSQFKSSAAADAPAPPPAPATAAASATATTAAPTAAASKAAGAPAKAQHGRNTEVVDSDDETRMAPVADATVPGKRKRPDEEVHDDEEEEEEEEEGPPRKTVRFDNEQAKDTGSSAAASRKHFVIASRKKLTAAIVKSLTADTTKLHQQDGRGVIEKHTERGFPPTMLLPDGLIDEDGHFVSSWTRAIAGQNLTKNDKQLLKYTIKVWPLHGREATPEMKNVLLALMAE